MARGQKGGYVCKLLKIMGRKSRDLCERDFGGGGIQGFGMITDENKKRTRGLIWPYGILLSGGCGRSGAQVFGKWDRRLRDARHRSADITSRVKGAWKIQLSSWTIGDLHYSGTGPKHLPKWLPLDIVNPRIDNATSLPCHGSFSAMARAFDNP